MAQKRSTIVAVVRHVKIMLIVISLWPRGLICMVSVGDVHQKQVSEWCAVQAFALENEDKKSVWVAPLNW